MKFRIEKECEITERAHQSASDAYKYSHIHIQINVCTIIKQRLLYPERNFLFICSGNSVAVTVEFLSNDFKHSIFANRFSLTFERFPSLDQKVVQILSSRSGFNASFVKRKTE